MPTIIRLDKHNKTKIRIKINPIQKNNIITTGLNKVIYLINIDQKVFSIIMIEIECKILNNYILKSYPIFHLFNPKLLKYLFSKKVILEGSFIKKLIKLKKSLNKIKLIKLKKIKSIRLNKNK